MTTYEWLSDRDEAERLASAGELMKIYLYPARFGGSNREEDVAFIPLKAAREKAQFDEMVGSRYDDGRITGYMCTAFEHEASLVPTLIRITAMSRAMPLFVKEIPIWEPGAK